MGWHTFLNSAHEASERFDFYQPVILMSTLTNRVTQLEAHAAKQVRPAGSWATYWQSLRKVYGDHGDYSAEELEQLDCIDPAPRIKASLDKVYGVKSDNKSTGESRET
jgi:hypothetical protein